MTTGYVYGLRCLHCGDTEFRYIGQTIQIPQRRFNNHKYYARVSDSLPVYRWIRKHGETNIVQDIIEVVEDATHLDEREVFHIAQARQTNTKPLLNLCDGGQGASGISDENRRARSERMKGQPGFFTGQKHSPESKALMSEKASNRKQSEETKARIGASHKGRKHTPEARANMKAAQIAAGPNIGPHNRFHAPRGVINPDCSFCVTP